MHDTGRRVLIDTLMSKIEFHRIINYQYEVEELLQQEDPNMINFIESSLQETPTTEKIISLDMPPQATFVTFRSSSSRLDQEEVQYLVTESIKKKELIPILAGEDKVVNTKVNVRIMDIRWMLRGGIGFLDFVTILSNYRRDKLFRTDLLRSLTHEYWIIYQRQIILRALLPWIVFSFMSILYFSNLSVG